MYIGDDKILYLFNKEYEKFALNALKQIGSLKYANEDMKKEFNRYFPKLETSFKTTIGQVGIVFKKEEDLILLRDLLSYCNGKLSVNTASWLLSSLYNIICFLHYNGLTHNGITIDSYFVSTKNKGGALLGGWWYSTKKGEKFSIDALNKKEINFDLKSIRYLGRVLLGDTEKSVGNIKRKVPKELLTWVRGKAENDAFYEYRRWKETIRKIAYERKK